MRLFILRQLKTFCVPGNCFGGLARLQAKLLDVAKKSKLLLINAGHSFDKELFNAFGFSAFEEAAKILEFSAQVQYQIVPLIN